MNVRKVPLMRGGDKAPKTESGTRGGGTGAGRGEASAWPLPLRFTRVKTKLQHQESPSEDAPVLQRVLLIALLVSKSFPGSLGCPLEKQIAEKEQRECPSLRCVHDTVFCFQ